MSKKNNVAKQTYDFEREVYGNCLSCGEDIVHPLCPNCISKAFHLWSRKFPEYREIKGKLNSFMKHHNLVMGQSKFCVSCGKLVHVCPYCFTEYLYSLVKEAGLGVRVMSEFLFLFNFDFEHKGYSRDLEVFGGW